MTDPVSLADQIACVRRELAMRASVYPHRIRSGKMTAAGADLETRRMQAVLDTLRRLAGEEIEGPQPLFYAGYLGNGEPVVRKRSVAKAVAGGRSFSLDFPVCRLHDASSNNAMSLIARGLNALMPPPADEPA